MKKSTFVLTTITMMFAFTALSCDRTADRMERAQTDVIEAERDVTIAQAEIEADAKIYRLEMASEFNENNSAIANIKERIKNEEPEVKASHEVRIRDLDRTNSNLKRQIDNYTITNRDHWDSFKEEFTSAMDELGNSLDNFFSRPTSSIN
jgi:hypothetical protein